MKVGKGLKEMSAVLRESLLKWEVDGGCEFLLQWFSLAPVLQLDKTGQVAPGLGVIQGITVDLFQIEQKVKIKTGRAGDLF